MREGLCWKCKEFVIKNVPANVGIWPMLHCHHEKEKLKCWCKTERATHGVYIIIKANNEQYALQINYCPQCGRKL